MHLSYIIPIMASWHLVCTELSKHKPEAVSKNIAHLLHSLIFLHHAMAIYLLNTALIAPQHTATLLHGCCILETSNLMLYVSYHVRKEHATRPGLIMASELVQLVWYTYYRIFKLTPFLYETSAEARSHSIGACAILAALYAMGAAWSYKLLQKNVHNYRNYRRNSQLNY